jgi:hypothetical protein
MVRNVPAETFSRNHMNFVQPEIREWSVDSGRRPACRRCIVAQRPRVEQSRSAKNSHSGNFANNACLSCRSRPACTNRNNLQRAARSISALTRRFTSSQTTSHAYALRTTPSLANWHSSFLLQHNAAQFSAPGRSDAVVSQFARTPAVTRVH